MTHRTPQTDLKRDLQDPESAKLYQEAVRRTEREYQQAKLEDARRYGIKQAMRFLDEVRDEPTLAAEIGKYLLPSRQWRKALTKALMCPAWRRPE